MDNYEVTLIESVRHRIVINADSMETARTRAWHIMEKDKSKFDKDSEWTEYAFIEKI